MSKIISFTKVGLPYGWLGNMSPHPIEYDGKTWRTGEALFQALRFNDQQIRALIWREKSPMSAKMAAKKHYDQLSVTPRSEEDLNLMRKVLRLKVEQHPQIKADLIATGDAVILEDSSARRNDSGLFWGAADVDGRWVGVNTLGVLWMELRDELKAGNK
jgi:hypothetical protein